MKLLSMCPSCGGSLTVKALQCAKCGLELHNAFELSAFDRLDGEQMDFLLCFLRCRGNLSLVQDSLCISYPAAKKRLSLLLRQLGLESTETEEKEKGEMDMERWETDRTSTKASEIIKTKLKQAGGRVIVHSVSGKAYALQAEADGVSFSSDALPLKPNYTYDVFDVVVDVMREQGGKARKGMGRNARLGEPNCEETTVVGAIGARYAGKKPGDSVYDPVFFLAAVLDWAGIAHNERGYLEFTAEYRERIGKR